MCWKLQQSFLQFILHLPPKWNCASVTEYYLVFMTAHLCDFFFSCRVSFRLVYIFSYNLFQFCGHTWILANTIARFLTFGQGKIKMIYHHTLTALTLYPPVWMFSRGCCLSTYQGLAQVWFYGVWEKPFSPDGLHFLACLAAAQKRSNSDITDYLKEVEMSKSV